MPWSKKQMAEEIIQLLTPGCSVNLGIGLPSLVAELIPPEHNIMIHSENGVLGVEGRPTQQTASPTLINAGKETISIKPGASYFDSALSFGMIRGGHIDFSVLGGMEVDSHRNLANWMIPGKKVTGMGGAMDLVNGAKKVIVMMTHFNKRKEPKIVKNTQLPLTGKHVVDIVVTDLGVFKFVETLVKKSKLEIIKIAPGVKEKDLFLP